MPSNTQLVDSGASAQKTVTEPPQPPPPLITIGARSTTPGANAAEEQNHCFKGDEESALIFTIASMDSEKYQLPENGNVTVEILSLDSMDEAMKISASSTSPAPTMPRRLQQTAIINNGRAVVTFPGHMDTGSHLPDGGPLTPPFSSKSSPGPSYSNLALITISTIGNADATRAVTYLYRYGIWTDQSR